MPSALPIAIVGLGCRFPQAPDIAAFWSLLDEGRDAVREVPADRWDAGELYDPVLGRPGKINSRFGAFLDDVRGFDPAFFGISPREALEMDPQQRLLLEVAAETFESAGLTNDRLAGTATGVFIGIGANDYSHRKLQRDGHRATIGAYTGTGQAHSIAANRISYVFDLRGPSMALDTACSSSLVAIHLACKSIASGESAMALAGGVSLMLTPETSIAFAQAHMLAADGRCKTFDAAADGYVRGEGCGLVLLKPLDAALRDGDPIAAVIAGGAINQDGRSNGLTAPSGLAQLDAVRTALAAANVEPHRISYVEAHGTGTPLGDPIEVRALVTALKPGRAAGAPARLGSVKTNIGHLECASGVAGVIKVALALERERIPRNLHFHTLNPLIELGGVLEVAAEPAAWPRGAEPRYAGVSSYGFGGANAHVILTEAPPGAPPRAASGRDWRLVTLSAKSAPALLDLAGAARAALDADPPPALADVAYTTTAGRTHFSQRHAIAVRSIDDLRDELEAIVDGRASARVHTRVRTDFARPRVGFLFSGQGAQYAGMARRLRASCATFATEFERCAAVLDPLLERPLSELVDGSGDPAALDRTANTQPALFAVEYALAKTWLAWGIEPHAMLGHSVGEYAAAALAGMLSLEDAATLVALRGRRMQALAEPGAMAALLAPPDDVARRIRDATATVSIAALNGNSTVISGARDAVERIVAEAKRDGVVAQRLAVSHAFHSPLLEPMLDDFERDAASFAYAPPSVPVISNLTGRPHEAAPDAGYWRRHAREPVAFAAGIAALTDAGCDVLLEVGPDATLCTLARELVSPAQATLVPSLRRGRDEWRTLCDAAAALYVRNAPIDWRAFERGEPGRIVRRWPTYPFAREPYWSAGESGESAASAAATETGNPLLGRRITAAQPIFSAEISLETLPFLADHTLDGKPLFPAAGFVELALAAAAQLPAGETFELADLTLRNPFFVEAREASTLQTLVRPDPVGGYELEFHARRGSGRWSALGGATLRRRAAAAMPAPGPNGVTGRRAFANGTPATPRSANGASHGATNGATAERIDGCALYALFASAGLGYGPAFQGVTAIERRAGIAEGVVAAPAAVAASLRAYRLHPALLDACFQVAAATVDERDAAFIPASIERVRVHGPLPARVRVRAVRRATSDALTLIVDLVISAENGDEVASVGGLRATCQGPVLADRKSVAAPIYRVRWEPVAPDAPRETGPLRWLALTDGPRGDALVTALIAQGGVVTRAAALPTEVAGYDGLLIAAPLDAGGTAPSGALDALLAQTRAAALAAKPPRVVVCTAGAQSVRASESAVPTAAALWGFASAVAVEHPELRFTCVDAPEAAQPGEAGLLARAIAAPPAEDRLALRDGTFHGARLGAWDPARSGDAKALAIPSGPFRLHSGKPGSLDALAVVPAEWPRPLPGHVTIAVRAAGLNFRDVMKALGIYPTTRGAAEWLGDECAGTIVAVGDGVHGHAPGDAVMALAPAAFGRFAMTRAELVAPLPAGADFERAAAVPVAYCTAWYALEHLARVRPGERVLIHAAAGGVGFAAVAVARLLGAEIYATAGSEEKRDFVRGLGVSGVFDSRSLDFVEELRAATGGAGVDVAINSLAGEAIPATLACLGPFGRFIEIGKKDIYANSRLPMQPFARNVSFAAVDMDALLFERPELGREIFTAVAERIARGDLPLPPVTTFPLAEAPAAFRYMAQARQIGKIALTVPPGSDRPGAYLVTGGFGGLGPPIAAWLHARGAATIVLASRSEPDRETMAAVDALRARGAAIVCERVDAGDEAALRTLLERIRRERGPLRGIVHAAGVLDDGVMLQQSGARFQRVLRPKADGAAHLDRLTADDDLDHFILFSSAAAVLGSPGQSNYAAANAFLGALANRRRARGKPALAVHWGPWAGPGMAARTPVRSAALSGPVRVLTAQAAFAALDRLVDAGAVEATVIDVDWTRWEDAVPNARQSPLVRELLPAREHTGPKTPVDGSTAPLRAAFFACPVDERVGWLEGHIAAAVAHVTDSDPSREFPVHTPIRDLGVDSLMGLELQLQFETELGVTIPRAMLMQSPTIHELAVATLALVDEPGSAAAPSPVVGAPAVGLAAATRPPAASVSEFDDGRLRLLCFAHAGTGAEAFRDLDRFLAPGVIVVPIEYPGRNRHRDRSPATNMDELVGAILPEILTHVGGPFALFGHSLGALVGFEVARRLERDGHAPRVLFASGSRAPSRRRGAPFISQLEHDAFVEHLGKYNGTPRLLLEDQGFMQLAVPVIRADFSIAEGYGVDDGVRIGTPIVAFGGDADPYVGHEDIASWSSVTTGSFATAVFPGDHFFLASALAQVGATIASYLVTAHGAGAS